MSDINRNCTNFGLHKPCEADYKAIDALDRNVREIASY
jgi:hypothetical protein